MLFGHLQEHVGACKQQLELLRQAGDLSKARREVVLACDKGIVGEQHADAQQKETYVGRRPLVHLREKHSSVKLGANKKLVNRSPHYDKAGLPLSTCRAQDAGETTTERVLITEALWGNSMLSPSRNKYRPQISYPPA